MLRYAVMGSGSRVEGEEEEKFYDLIPYFEDAFAGWIERKLLDPHFLSVVLGHLPEGSFRVRTRHGTVSFYEKAFRIEGGEGFVFFLEAETSFFLSDLVSKVRVDLQVQITVSYLKGLFFEDLLLDSLRSAILDGAKEEKAPPVVDLSDEGVFPDSFLSLLLLKRNVSFFSVRA